ncbi:DUF3325 domain-containing protein [Methylobacterium sp. ID0610]|uniref:DUF3325 domain-containing protein n=1 Tax=Methylobacterium carpenticola TaxID=3344827 RepID=UPI00367B743A
MTPVVLLANLGLGFLGLSALCFSMGRHHAAAFERPLDPRRALRLRALGWGLIALSLAAAILFEGWNFGPVQWLGSLSGAGLALIVTLSYRPRAPWCAAVLDALLRLTALPPLRAERRAGRACDQLTRPS